MKDTNSQEKLRNSARDASDIRVVRVASNPGLDAEDQLRRLLTLMVKLATQDRPPSASSGQAHASEKDSPTDGDVEGKS